MICNSSSLFPNIQRICLNAAFTGMVLQSFTGTLLHCNFFLFISWIFDHKFCIFVTYHERTEVFVFLMCFYIFVFTFVGIVATFGKEKKKTNRAEISKIG